MIFQNYFCQDKVLLYQLMKLIDAFFSLKGVWWQKHYLLGQVTSNSDVISPSIDAFPGTFDIFRYKTSWLKEDSILKSFDVSFGEFLIIFHCFRYGNSLKLYLIMEMANFSLKNRYFDIIFVDIWRGCVRFS